MENKEIEYIDIYAKELLNSIKSRVRKNYIQLVNEEETDQKMLKVIKDLCCKNDNETITMINTKDDSERVMNTLVIYYTALYFDNLKLLNDLLAKGYNFGHNIYDSTLCVLDKRFSSLFDEEKYIELVFKKGSLISSFYNSLRNQKIPMNDDECIKEFCDILKENPDINILSRKNDNSCVGPIEITNLLTKKTIYLFGKGMLLKATDDQKDEIINRIDNQEMSQESFSRLLNLMKNYNLSIFFMGQWEEVFKNLTDEEIIMASQNKKFIFYECMNHQHVVDFDEVKKRIYNSSKDKQKKLVNRKFNFFRKRS